tara:strand:- start:479 stop:928 length:450 start_codon:yes stop_codon:yes gene_type:complete
MKFTVREVGVSSITVDFEDGSWAEVPISEEDSTKEKLIATIMQFAPKPPISFVDNMPLSVGEEVDPDEHPLTEEAEEEEEVEPRLTWEQMRKELYPSLRDQADAMYWSRHGKPELLEEIDAAIKEVKTTIPKGMNPMTRGELSEYLLNL